MVPNGSWFVLAAFLAFAGIVCVPLSIAFRRAAKHKAEREARKRADLIRQRLAEEPGPEHRPVEIRLGTHAGR